jgi:type IVB pilus formation R64 PilN family outer membrane protein
MRPQRFKGFSRALLTPIAFGALTLLLGGCETTQHAADTDASVDKRSAEIAAKMGVPPNTKPYGDIVHYLDADQQYVATDPVITRTNSARTKRSHLQCHLNVVTDQPISLLEAAQLVQRECHVPVRVTQDALQQINGQIGSMQTMGAGGGSMPAPTGSIVPAVGSGMGGVAGASRQGTPTMSYGGAFGDNGLIDVNFDGDGQDFLDMLTARMGGLSWKEADDGAIRIYAMDTRTFAISALATDATTLDSNFQSGTTTTTGATADGTGGTSGGGGGGGGSSGNGQGSNSTMQQTSVKMKSDLWSDIQKALDTMAGKGNAVCTPSTGTVTVRGNIDTLDAVNDYVSYQNKRLEKGVTFHIEVWSVTLSNQDAAGVNWNAMYQTLAGKYGMTLAGGFAAPTGAIAAGFSILSSSGSPWAGSQAVVSALNQQGKTKLERQQDLPTLNFSPVATQVGEQQGYIVGESTTNTANVGSQTSIQTGTVTYGFNVSLSPYIMDNNNILVQFNINLSNLTQIRQITAGDAYAEAPELALPLNTVQKVKVQPGQMLVLTGINNVDDSSTRTGTGWHWNWLAGGGINANGTHTQLIVLITPVMQQE